ncbi:hypothetical protein QE367_002156 [Microbacterium paludicola]|uniref:Uncharacterized protein n=1 Tax=Microbacterium paludicola TaxID=300019 RepID=A0ABU1I368_9MICO|nr:hypothetical protein [Microbacterium paludicola]
MAAMINGTIATNTHRQPTRSAAIPARSGPTSEGMVHADDSNANICARSDSGYARPIAV